MFDSNRPLLSEASRGRLIAAAWVAGFLAVLGALYLWGCLGPRPAQSPHHAAEAHCQYAQQPRTKASRAPRPPLVIFCFQANAEDGASDADRNAPTSAVPLSQFVARKIVSDPVALFAVVLSLLTWRLIVVGRDQHNRLQESLDWSRKDFDAEHRPWVSVDPSITGPLIWDDNGLNFSLLFVMKNTGRTPAIDAHVDFKIYHKFGGDLVADQLEFAQSVRTTV
jgi:hypothetical protein